MISSTGTLTRSTSWPSLEADKKYPVDIDPDTATTPEAKLSTQTQAMTNTRQQLVNFLQISVVSTVVSSATEPVHRFIRDTIDENWCCLSPTTQGGIFLGTLCVAGGLIYQQLNTMNNQNTRPLLN